jgi:hypothetical protein
MFRPMTVILALSHAATMNQGPEVSDDVSETQKSDRYKVTLSHAEAGWPTSTRHVRQPANPINCPLKFNKTLRPCRAVLLATSAMTSISNLCTASCIYPNYRMEIYNTGHPTIRHDHGPG